MFADHIDLTVQSLALWNLIKIGRVRHREVKEFAQGHTALKRHSQVFLTLEPPHPNPWGTVPGGQRCQVGAAGRNAAISGRLSLRLQATDGEVFI